MLLSFRGFGGGFSIALRTCRANAMKSAEYIRSGKTRSRQNQRQYRQTNLPLVAATETTHAIRQTISPSLMSCVYHENRLPPFAFAAITAPSRVFSPRQGIQRAEWLIQQPYAWLLRDDATPMPPAAPCRPDSSDGNAFFESRQSQLRQQVADGPYGVSTRDTPRQLPAANAILSRNAAPGQQVRVLKT